MTVATLLEKRKQIKKRGPHFVKHDSKVKARVKARWRKPRGRHSAIRERKAGRQPLVSSGYGAPTAVRGLHPSGLRPVIVETVKQLKGITKEQQGIVIAHGVGVKKRLTIIQQAIEKGIRVLNVTDPSTTMRTIQQAIDDRRKQHRSVAEEKAIKAKKEQEQKEEKAKPVAATEGAAEKESGPPEKEAQEEERKEIEKTLIKRQ